MRQVRAAPFPAITTPTGNFVVVTFCTRGVKGENVIKIKALTMPAEYC